MRGWQIQGSQRQRQLHAVLARDDLNGGGRKIGIDLQLVPNQHVLCQQQLVVPIL